MWNLILLPHDLNLAPEIDAIFLCNVYSTRQMRLVEYFNFTTQSGLTTALRSWPLPCSISSRLSTKHTILRRRRAPCSSIAGEGYTVLPP